MFFGKKSAPCRCDALGLTDSHAKRNHFPRNFRTVPVVVVGGFFRPRVISPPTRESALACQRCVLTETARRRSLLGRVAGLSTLFSTTVEVYNAQIGIFLLLLAPHKFYLDASAGALTRGILEVGSRRSFCGGA